MLDSGLGDGAVHRLVDVLIVNYKTPELTIRAVESVLGESELGTVIVVDNASGDGSADQVEARFAQTPSVHVIRSPENAGFGAGNNLAARAASSRYLFLLNSDAAIEPGCMGKLVAVLEGRPDIGLVAPAVYLLGGALQEGSYGSFPTPATIFLRANRRVADTHTPDWISGVAFMARREEYLRLGGFDEGFFMYHEDVDLCRRFRDAGLIAYRELGAAVVHMEGGSSPSNRARLAAYDASQDRYLAVSGTSPFGRATVRIARGLYRGLRVRANGPSH